MSELRERRLRAAAAVVCTLLVSLLAAGCGGSGSSGGPSADGPPLSKAAYEAGVARAVEGLKARYGSASADPATMSADRLGRVQDGLRYLADRFDRLSPPVEVRDLHERFVTALRAFADELPALTAKARKDPSSALADLLGSKPFQSLLHVSRLFQQKGYDVELTG